MIIYICKVIKINTDSIQEWHQKNKDATLYGRYITFSDIKPLIDKLNQPFAISRIDVSVQNRPIYKINIGSGSVKVLAWSQMHGNESTGTKALFDLFNFFQHPKEFKSLRDQILKNCTISFIPMLNPDGAQAYTRVNANNIDLNRDIVDLKAPESNALIKVLKEVHPNYCFNLHDQRTIFSVGKSRKPATLSFLAPSINKERTITNGRKETMQVIVAINKLLQQIIPESIGRYTDEFYPTATGDNFQKMGHNTILIEAGHFKDDYNREVVRRLNFISLVQGLNFISSNDKSEDFNAYFNIPDNEKYYLDIIYKDVFLESESKKVDVGIVFKEELIDEKITFIPVIEHIGNLENYNTNQIIDEKGLKFSSKKELQRFLKKKC